MEEFSARLLGTDRWQLVELGFARCVRDECPGAAFDGFEAASAYLLVNLGAADAQPPGHLGHRHRERWVVTVPKEAERIRHIGSQARSSCTALVWIKQF